jgi:CRISPR-associated exonuclease Cas4
MIPLRVNDLKQYAYCPRVVFYQYCMPVNKKPTWKMEQGKVAEGNIDELEKRRKLREYRLAEGRREFHVWLSSKRLGLSGKLDLLIESPEGLFPVDFKMTAGRPYKNHVMQLCGYARLLEDCYGREVLKGFVYLIPQNDAVVFDLTEERKKEADALIGEIRRMIETEQMPPPTPVRNRCADCEFRNYCGDIF